MVTIGSSEGEIHGVAAELLELPTVNWACYLKWSNVEKHAL